MDDTAGGAQSAFTPFAKSAHGRISYEAVSNISIGRDSGVSSVVRAWELSNQARIKDKKRKLGHLGRAAVVLALCALAAALVDELEKVRTRASLWMQWPSSL